MILAANEGYKKPRRSGVVTQRLAKGNTSRRIGAGEQLARAANFVLGVANHFVELGNPTHGAGQGKNTGEQIHRNANGALHDA